MNCKLRIEEALQALRTKPLKSTTFERVQILHSLQHKYDGLPHPLRFGNVLYDFFDQVSTPVEPHDIIVGRHLDKPLNAEEEAFFQAFLHDPKNLYRTTLYETGHCTLDWQWLIQYGLSGLKERAMAGIPNAKDDEHAVFLKGAVRVYDAFINFARRYAEAAKNAGLAEAADALFSLTQGAPQTFHEALQLIWLVNLADDSYLTLNPTLTQGRLDIILLPLYEADLKAGRLTEDGALEIITDFYCKHNLIMGRGEHQMGDHTNTTCFERILNFDAPQYLPLAGTDKDGRPVVNALTLLFSRAITPGFKNPIPVIRYFKGMDTACPELWNILMEKSLQSCSMMIYNDADIKSGLIRAGVEPEDANDYEHFACNWCSPGPNSQWMSSAPRAVHFVPDMPEDIRKKLQVPYVRTRCPNGWPAEFVNAMHELNDRPDPPTSIDDFYDLFFQYFRDFIKMKIDNLVLELELRQRHPSKLLTLGDCINRWSIERAECKNATAKYHFQIQTFCGIATLVDCFSAVDQLLFIDHSTTLSELVAAVDANYKGYETLLALCRKAEKFGSDGALTNRHAERIAKMSLEICYELGAEAVKKYKLFLMPSLQGDTWHLKMGAICGATPNGRLAGEPFTQSSRPANGSCKKGLTAMFSSLLHLPFDQYTSGSLNLDVQPENFAGEEGRILFGKLLGNYFNRGGLHAQVSCVSVDDLKDAQIHPENHRDLLVRITGYSGVFVDMCETIQNDVIARMNP